MKVLLVTAGYSIFNAKGQLNGFLANLTENNLTKKGRKVKVSDVAEYTWDVDTEVEKILWAETIIYIMPMMWFNIPAPMVKWLAEVLLYEKTFVITEEYGEGGQVPADKFMIVITSHLKTSNLGKGFVLKDANHIDDLLRPLIYTNTFLSIRDQIPTFHAGDVLVGNTDWIEKAYQKHLDTYIK